MRLAAIETTTEEFSQRVQRVRPGMRVRQVSAALGSGPFERLRRGERTVRRWRFLLGDVELGDPYRLLQVEFIDGRVVESHVLLLG